MRAGRCQLNFVPAEGCSAALSLGPASLPSWLQGQVKHCMCVLRPTQLQTQAQVPMDAPTPRQQLIQALPELFPGDNNTAFRGNAAVGIGRMPRDWSAGLMGLPVGDRVAAIQSAARGGWSSCDSMTRCSDHMGCLVYANSLEDARRHLEVVATVVPLAWARGHHVLDGAAGGAVSVMQGLRGCWRLAPACCTRLAPQLSGAPETRTHGRPRFAVCTACS
jgi:hypothetical protein